ncbi:putative LPS assembly protein LptD [Chlorobaculum thiosulfatiphilum]|uniref:putative LPS assembly protein LptD n=1 Tax=Chlorobaculum thiosulfatiphilum TaxID=115852 RepID=UPI001FE480D8|nr:putative LPS assembly protein LptD [Chlorobaculum thiosulfatiphilum]
MKLTKSIKLLSLLLLVQSFEGFAPLRAGESASKPQSEKEAATPDSLARKPDDLDSTVVYTARDSLIYNVNKRTADLFGKAKVNYRDSRIEGPTITVEQGTSTARAKASRDSLGRPSELPVYTDSAGSFTAETMAYNYKTRIGTASDISSKDEQGIYSGRNVKRMPSGELYIEDGVYTTCDLEEPHYWFEGEHMRIIPDDRLISRPFIMYIHPEIFNKRLPVLPVMYLPYMSAPISNKRASGFLFPRLGSGGDMGTYLSNLGYFWAISDYADLRVEGDVSFNGSWRLGQRFRYQNGDLYSGSITGEYEKIMLNDSDDPDHRRYINRDLRIIHHQQFDPTARLDVNLQYLGGDRYYDNTSIDLETLVAEQATSYASFSKSWDENNRVLIAGYQKVDDLSTGELTQKATASLYQNRIYPFRPRLSSSPSESPGWSSRLFVQPTLSGSALFNEAWGIKTDFYSGNAGLEFGYLHDFSPGYRALFTQGINVQALGKTISEQDDLDATSIQLPFKIQSTLFKYLHLTPAVTFTQYRVNSTVSKYYDTSAGEELTNTIAEPASYATTVFSLDAQTRLYGVMNTGFLDKLTGLSAIRHTFIPTVSFIYNPDYRGSGYDIYDSYYDPVALQNVRYNRFGESLYSAVPEERTFVGLSLQNLFHGKFRSDEVSSESGDSAGAGYKTAQLLSLTASSGYNFAADEMPIAPLVLMASSNAFAPALMFSAGATYDFYTYDPLTGDRVDKLAMDDGKGLLRFVNGFLNMSVSKSGHLRSPFASVDKNDSDTPLVKNTSLPVEQALYKERFHSDELTDFSASLPWSLRMSLYLISDKSDPLDPYSTALLNSAGRLALSRNWQVGFSTSYDFRNNEFVYPALMLYRDLHDFQFSAQWVPSGEHKGYLFQIAMKPANLKYLKLKAGSGNIVQPVD